MIQKVKIITKIMKIAVLPKKNRRHFSNFSEGFSIRSTTAPAKIYGSNRINKGLSKKAFWTCRLSKWCKERWDPHPGHSKPVREWKGQAGKKFVAAGS